MPPTSRAALPVRLPLWVLAWRGCWLMAKPVSEFLNDHGLSMGFCGAAHASLFSDRHRGDDIPYHDLCSASSRDLPQGTSSDDGHAIEASRGGHDRDPARGLGHAHGSGDHLSSSGPGHLDGGHRSRGCLWGDVSGCQSEPWSSLA